MTRVKWIKGCATLVEACSGLFLGASYYHFSEDTVFMSIYGLLAAFFCLAYAHFLRITHLKGI